MTLVMLGVVAVASGIEILKGFPKMCLVSWQCDPVSQQCDIVSQKCDSATQKDYLVFKTTKKNFF